MKLKTIKINENNKNKNFFPLSLNLINLLTPRLIQALHQIIGLYRGQHL